MKQQLLFTYSSFVDKRRLFSEFCNCLKGPSYNSFKFSVSTFSTLTTKHSSWLQKRGHDDVTKTKFVTLWDYLAYPERKKIMKNVHLRKISLLVQSGVAI